MGSRAAVEVYELGVKMLQSVNLLSKVVRGKKYILEHNRDPGSASNNVVFSFKMLQLSVSRTIGAGHA